MDEAVLLVQLLNSLNFLIVRLYRKESTCLDRLSIQQHRAGTAAGSVTTDVCTGQCQII